MFFFGGARICLDGKSKESYNTNRNFGGVYMDKKKIIKLAGMALCVVLITGLGTWLIHIDKQKEGMIEVQPTQSVTRADNDETTEDKTIIESQSVVTKKLELNMATKEELSTLPGIGPALAERIIEHRTKTPFKMARDIKKVPGIGHKKYTDICELIYVEGE